MSSLGPYLRGLREAKGMSLDDIDLVEINDTFAPVPPCVMPEPGMDPGRVRV